MKYSNVKHRCIHHARAWGDDFQEVCFLTRCLFYQKASMHFCLKHAIIQRRKCETLAIRDIRGSIKRLRLFEFCTDPRSQQWWFMLAIWYVVRNANTNTSKGEQLNLKQTYVDKDWRSVACSVKSGHSCWKYGNTCWKYWNLKSPMNTMPDMCCIIIHCCPVCSNALCFYDGTVACKWCAAFPNSRWPVVVQLLRLVIRHNFLSHLMILLRFSIVERPLTAVTKRKITQDRFYMRVLLNCKSNKHHILVLHFN